MPRRSGQSSLSSPGDLHTILIKYYNSNYCYFRSLSALGNLNPSALPLHPGGVLARPVPPRCGWHLMVAGHKPWGQEAVCPSSSSSAL